MGCLKGGRKEERVLAVSRGVSEGGRRFGERLGEVE